MKRRAYIAQYDADGNETILMRAPYWNADISAEFDRLAASARLGTPVIEGWYSDDYQVECMGRIDCRPRLPRHA